MHACRSTLEDPTSLPSYTGYVLSRLSDTAKKGYALLVRRSKADPALYPELRFYSHGVLSTCAGQIPIVPGEWSHLAALISDGHVQGADAGVWVNGQPSCVVAAGDAKLDKYPATPIVGAALGGAVGFFRGLLDDVYVSRSDMSPPPALNGGGCAQEVVFFASFDAASSQPFAPLCSPAGTVVTLGASPNVEPSDPSLVCP